MMFQIKTNQLRTDSLKLFLLIFEFYPKPYTNSFNCDRFYFFLLLFHFGQRITTIQQKSHERQPIHVHKLNCDKKKKIKVRKIYNKLDSFFFLILTHTLFRYRSLLTRYSTEMNGCEFLRTEEYV